MQIMDLHYGKIQGHIFEHDLCVELKKYFGSNVLNEDELERKYGKCISGIKNCVGVDIACTDGTNVYVIQCKQVKHPSSMKAVQEFIDYSYHISKKIGRSVIKIWASSIDPCKSGIELCNAAGVKRITYTTTASLITNVISWILHRKEIVDDIGDYLMV
jgi:hypothetical protein